MGSIADRSEVPWRGRNFEDFYSDLSEDPKKVDIRKDIEDFVWRYFSALELPTEPTLYDYLVLSLREKDVIATFNWDPFLAQAITRNVSLCNHQRVLFLHGDVTTRYREDQNGKIFCKRADTVRPYEIQWKKPPILFPVRRKDYQTDPFIKKQWKLMNMALQDAYVFTVFGYGAPTSDLEAVKLLSDGWGSPDARNLEEFEFIDLKPEEELKRTWSRFIHSHHYHVHDSFFDSSISRMPRRSAEGVWNRTQELQWDTDQAPAPAIGTVPLGELQNWYRPLILDERIFTGAPGDS